MTGPAGVLVGADEVRRSLASAQPPVLLDVRWRLDQPDGRSAYLAGHLPGAVYVSLDDDLSDHTLDGRGRHPLPSGAHLQAAARRWGITEGRPVVVYDDWNRAGSARAWWVLTAAGLPDVRILDGGLAGWTASGGALATGPVHPAAGDVVLTHPDLYSGALPTLTADQVADRAVATLLDARAPERFAGAVEPVDAVAGHIPGAVNLPSLSVLDGDGRFRPAAQIHELLGGRGGQGPVGVYCGSGVTAAVVIAALTAAGVDAALFPGSWSQWSAAGLPAARGQSRDQTET